MISIKRGEGIKVLGIQIAQRDSKSIKLGLVLSCTDPPTISLKLWKTSLAISPLVKSTSLPLLSERSHLWRVIKGE